MNDNRVFVKNVRSWFTNWKSSGSTPSFVGPQKYTDRQDISRELRDYFNKVKPIDIHNPVYLFTSQAWFYGINTHSDRVSKSILADKSASVVSIMPSTPLRRKIVERIKISCDKNIVGKNADMLEFTILRVKRSIYGAEATDNYKTNGLRNWNRKGSYYNLYPPLIGFRNETNDLKTHENIHICSDDIQLVNRGSFFSSSEVLLDNLDYDLGSDDDLILIQKISFDKNIEAQSVGVHFGISRKEYADYRIEVKYSYGYI